MRKQKHHKGWKLTPVFLANVTWQLVPEHIYKVCLKRGLLTTQCLSWNKKHLSVLRTVSCSDAGGSYFVPTFYLHSNNGDQLISIEFLPLFHRITVLFELSKPASKATFPVPALLFGFTLWSVCCFFGGFFFLDHGGNSQLTMDNWIYNFWKSKRTWLCNINVLWTLWDFWKKHEFILSLILRNKQQKQH